MKREREVEKRKGESKSAKLGGGDRWQMSQQKSVNDSQEIN